MNSLLLLSPLPRLSCVLAAAVVMQPLVAAADDVRLELTRDENVMQVEWMPARGVLQMSSSVTGAWVNVSVESPSWFTRSSSAFFRVLDIPTTDAVALGIGADLYQSQGFMPLTLPAGFFGPGSQPFEGTIQFHGNPLETRGAFELGTTDTVVQRREPAHLPPPPSETTIPIELVALSLVSVQPIIVTYPSGPPQQWQVYLQNGSVSPTNNSGQMTVHYESISGGTFDAQFPVLPMLVFRNLSNPTDLRSNTLPLLQMIGSNGVCSTTGGCATDSLRVPRLPLGLCMQGIQMEGSQLHLFLNAPSAASHPPPNVDPGATVDPGVASLGRFATISDGASIGAQAVIGPYAFIGSNVVVGSNVLIGANAVIGANSVIGADTIIDDGTQVGTNSIIGSNVVIGVACQLGGQSQVGANSRVGDRNVIGDAAQLGANVVCERDVTIGAGATLVDGLHLVHGAQVGPAVFLDQSLLLCALQNGTKVIMSSTNCEAQDGAVLGLLSAQDRFLRTVLTVIKKVTPLPWNPTNPPAGLTNLQNDVNNAGGTTTNGPIKDRTWVPDTYDCEDFAGDMEKALQALGYDATFTAYWHVVPNPDYHWWNSLWAEEFIEEAHGLTDVHTADGLIWIEPQTGEIGVDLDFDGDGKVGYDTKHPGEVTDDDGRIEVYDSREAAEKAGVGMD